MGPFEVMANNVDSVFVYDQMGDYNRELRYLLNALDKSKSDTSAINLNNQIGGVYMSLNNFPKALEYYNKSLDLCARTPNKIYEENTQTSLGILFAMQQSSEKALECFGKALEIAKILKDEDGVAVLHTDLAVIYSQEKKYAEALNNLFESLKYFSKVKNYNNISGTYYAIGALYEDQNNIASALEFQQLALEAAKKGNYKEAIRKDYKVLSELYAKSKSFEYAYKYHLSYTNLKDSIFSEEKNKQIVEMQTKYETVKKEQQLKLQKADLDKKNIYTVILLIGIGVALIIILLVYYNFRKTAHAKALVEAYNTIIEHKNKEVKDSINYAQGIQFSILPVLPSRADLFFSPKDIVSGDFYWHKTIVDEEFYAVADCTGHGVPGALLSMLCTELLNAAVQKTSSPHLILEYVNKELKSRMDLLGRKDGMEIALIKYCATTKRLNYAGANRPLFMKRKFVGVLEVFKPNKCGVGGSSDKDQTFGNYQFEVESGDMVYMTTDGFTDQFGHNNKKFGSKQFKEVLSLGEPSAQNLKETMNLWMGATEQTDDILVMKITF